MMTQILDYVYFRELDIRSDNARQLLVTADYLFIPDLRKLCYDYLKVAMDVYNCIGILSVARSHSCADLEAHARRLVLRHFGELYQQSEELLELDVEELQAIIRSDKLNVKDEKVVWECILRWLNHDPDNRKDQITGLLKCVRLGLFDAKYILKEVLYHPYVKENEECRPVILETLEFLYASQMMTKEYKEIVTPGIARPRIPQDILFAIGGVRDRRVSDVIEAYVARADRWSVVEGVDSIGPRACHGTTVIGFDVYVIGGTDDGFDGLRSCRCFNSFTKTCREVAPMNAPRARLMVAVLRGVVYAMGGYEDHVAQRTAESYDSKTNQWSWIAPMNSKRSNAGVAVRN
ncbi:kelch-like protein 10, partial [Zootermopsis nevadensis]